MPRFLDTLTGKFVWKDKPDEVAYAILSHTWKSAEEGGEQSFDDIKALQDEMMVAEAEAMESAITTVSSASNTADSELMPKFTIFSHNRLSDKILQLCNIARKDGYRLVWDDTCCIDKSSSAELTEAISSMFELYRLSEVCYVYLTDVPQDEPGLGTFSEHSYFSNSRWHSRGWTLQELIAPRYVVFLTQTWTVFGTKLQFASWLNQITGIDLDILTGRATLDSISVARRMSWAAKRQTTRVEDRAYSLMGIFGVRIPTIYGEGSNAFLRLQEEIIRTTPDQTIFAWGPPTRLSTNPLYNPLERQLSRSKPVSHTIGLLAPSPDCFMPLLDPSEISGRLTPSMPSPLRLSRAEFASRLRRDEKDVPDLRSVVTPYGIEIELLCIDVRWSFPCAECQKLSGTHACRLALLQCSWKTQGYFGEEYLVALPLCPSQSLGSGDRRGLEVRTHTQSLSCGNQEHSKYYHIILVPKAFFATRWPLQQKRTLKPDRVSLLHHCPDPTPSQTSLQKLLGRAIKRAYSLLETTIRVAPRCTAELDFLGFTISPPAPQFYPSPDNLQTRFMYPVPVTMTTLLQTGSQETLKTIELQVMIHATQPQPETCLADEEWELAIRFSVTSSNYFSVARPDYRDDVKPTKFETLHLTPSPTPLPRATPWTLADVECIIWSPDEPNDRRVLRIALEHAKSQDQTKKATDVLWLYVEVSGPPEWDAKLKPENQIAVSAFLQPMSVFRCTYGMLINVTVACRGVHRKGNPQGSFENKTSHTFGDNGAGDCGDLGITVRVLIRFKVSNRRFCYIAGCLAIASPGRYRPLRSHRQPERPWY